MLKTKFQRQRRHSSPQQLKKLSYYSSNKTMQMGSTQRGQRSNSDSTYIRTERNQATSKSGRVQASKLPTYFAIILIVFSLAYTSYLSANANIIYSSKNRLYSSSYYQEQINSVLAGSIINRTKLSLNVRQAENDIRQKLSDVSQVTISLPIIGKKPIVGLSFYKPKYIINIAGTDYVLSDKGVIMAKTIDVGSYADELDSQLMHINEEVPHKVELGKPILQETDIAFIDSVVGELAKQGNQIDQITLPKNAGQLVLKLKNQQPILKFSFFGDAYQQVGEYIATKNQLGPNNQPSSYYDMRVGERVYVQ